MAVEDPEEIVRLATATNPAQAHIWREELEEEGIRCQVVGDYLDAGIGDIPGISAELWVARKDAERAAAILQEGEDAVAAEPDEDEPGPAEGSA